MSDKNTKDAEAKDEIAKSGDAKAEVGNIKTISQRTGEFIEEGSEPGYQVNMDDSNALNFIENYKARVAGPTVASSAATSETATSETATGEAKADVKADAEPVKAEAGKAADDVKTATKRSR